jgi:biotin carboxylase
MTILCISSYEKGHDFIRACKARGWHVIFLTVESLADAPWPRESIDEFFMMPDLLNRGHVINAVSYLARTRVIDRIVALDEFDIELAAHLREHLRVPGMGETTSRYFRDKLAMRLRAREEGIPVPSFVHVLNHDLIRQLTERVPPPWVLKPRSSAAAIGIKKVNSAEELWRAIDALGDEQSFHLLEQFVPGDIYHVDSITSECEVVFDIVHKYGHPPMSVAHEGGIFTTRTWPRQSSESLTLRKLNADLLQALGMVRGVAHTEFIHGEDGQFYFLETAARVGGAFITDTVEVASGINLWEEWARIETATSDSPYRVAPTRDTYAGLILSLARQEWPDLSEYQEPEIAKRIKKAHHAGLIVASPEAARIKHLLDDYTRRFFVDFHASEPVPGKPTA